MEDVDMEDVVMEDVVMEDVMGTSRRKDVIPNNSMVKMHDLFTAC